MNRVHFSTKTDLWETPKWLFDALDREFCFSLDVCATKRNTKCAQFYSRLDDGLALPWEGVCWMNPPFGGRGKIDPWIRKARLVAENGEATVVCLVPARTGSPWFFDDCSRGEIRFIKSKLTFGKAKTVAPFNSAVVIFRRGDVTPKVSWWKPERKP